VAVVVYAGLYTGLTTPLPDVVPVLPQLEGPRHRVQYNPEFATVAFAGHDTHEPGPVEPVVGVYIFEPHGVHPTEFPKILEYLPPSHGVHEGEPTPLEYVPAVH
jgi:hypothetical protein